jgi:LuxR family maltose regulon positive regulatory protein
LLEQVYRVGQRPLFIQQLLDAFPATAVPPVIVQQPLIESLTDREMDVLNLLAQRLSNKEIAQELVIAPETVKRHTINIYQKLGVESRRQAVVQAYTIGLLK